MTTPKGARPARSFARASVGLSATSIVSALCGWLAFAGAIVLGDHFDRVDPRSAVLLLLSVALGLGSLGAWIAGCVTAGLAFSRARTADPRGVANVAIAMAAVVPFTWMLEWGALVLWFGFEALSGPLVV